MSDWLKFSLVHFSHKEEKIIYINLHSRNRISKYQRKTNFKKCFRVFFFSRPINQVMWTKTWTFQNWMPVPILFGKFIIYSFDSCANEIHRKAIQPAKYQWHNHSKHIQNESKRDTTTNKILFFFLDTMQKTPQIHKTKPQVANWCQINSKVICLFTRIIKTHNFRYEMQLHIHT